MSRNIDTAQKINKRETKQRNRVVLQMILDGRAEQVFGDRREKRQKTRQAQRDSALREY